MIGDTQAGSCGALTFGGEIGAVVAHPTFACSRLNIAEQNSPLVRDRGFFSYRHFQNASEVNIFGDQPAGGASNLNIDRFIFGFEKRIFGKSSVEFRLPLTYQLDSDLAFSKFTGMPSSLPLSDRTEDIGNLSLVFKRLVHQSRTLVLSGGVGLNIPTAADVSLSGRIDDDFFPVTDNMGMPDTFDVDMTFRGVVKNETVNLSPFVATLWTPTPRFFAQGFLQVDVPLNRSNAALMMDGSIDGDTTLIPTTIESGNVAQQILMRINAGVGYWFYRNRCASCVTGIAGLLEIHHTSTLESADTLGPFVVIPAPTADFQDTVLEVGNLANQNDITNLVVGNTIELGQQTSITNGFVLPLSTGDNRGFDFEYNFFIQHLF